jgi:hypothetical protein
MGFGGFLKGLGKGIANVATGGIAGPVMDALGGGAKAAKDGRMSEAELQALITGQNNRNQLDAAQFNAGREGSLIKRALSARMLGDMGGSMAPRDPRDKFGGGEVSPVLQQLLARYGGMADKDVMSGGYKVQPQMASIPKSGLMEKIGGVAGLGGGLLGILGQMRPRTDDEQPPIYGPGN